MSSGKLMIIQSIAGLIKKIPLYEISQYFSKPHERSSENVKVELDPSNFATS